MSEKILQQLNAAQRQAVTTTEGPVLILAGAGSGKTKTLTARIAYLIDVKKVEPAEILAVTFTNKASGAMQHRVYELMGQRARILPWLGTFHSICVRILRKELNDSPLPYTNNFTIYDSSDQLSLVRQIMKDRHLDQKQYNPRAVKSYIESAKNELLDPAGYRTFVDSYFQELVATVYEEYQSRLQAANSFDFDDLINFTLKLFSEQPETLHKYQQLFRYILVDEYQDTNKGQYQLIKSLAAIHQNIFVVGDDWQAIYSFRGADFRNILNFEQDYPKAVVIKLEQNYRSTQNILDAAHHIIAKNQQRSKKQLFTEASEGYPIKVVQCRNDWAEGEFMIQECRRLIRENTSTLNSLEDIVVLYRTNAQSRSLEEALIKADIPYRVIGAVRFYDRREIKDQLAYLRLLSNPDDRVSFERAISVPPRKIGPKTLQQYRAVVESPKPDQPSTTETRRGEVPPRVRDFLLIIERLRDLVNKIALNELLMKVAIESGYRDWVRDGTIEGESRWENILELQNAAAQHGTLEAFLERVALVQDTDLINEKRRGELYDHAALGATGKLPGLLTLMTVHAAKGLEFDTVFIMGMEEGLFPHANALREVAEMEEERRLAYVGLTRAKRHLYLVMAEERRYFGTVVANPPSRFVTEIPEHLIEISEW